MTVEANKALVCRVYAEIVNTGNLELIDEVVSEGFIEHEAFPGVPSTGPKAAKAVLAMFLAAFPDLAMTVDDVIAEGDTVAVRGTMSGTQKSEFMGIPPSNKSFMVPFIDIVEVRDGLATAHWGVRDQVAIMEQLGLIPEV